MGCRLMGCRLMERRAGGTATDRERERTCEMREKLRMKPLGMLR
jgi:hypothetical protein